MKEGEHRGCSKKFYFPCLKEKKIPPFLANYEWRKASG